MRHPAILFSVTLFVQVAFSSCKQTIECDLALTNVMVFNSENKTITEGRTILISADTIQAIISNEEKFSSKLSIDGKGRLVTPGFIDTHIHLTDLLGDYEAAPEYLHKDSVTKYKKRIAETYLAYGITTIKEAGCPEKWLSETIKWQQNPRSDFPNFYTCGSALISDEERIPYIGHKELKDPEEALKKIDEYAKIGLKYIKLYSRLRTPEMKACMKRANELNLNVCAHLERHILIDTALVYGVRHFEHVFTLAPNVLSSELIMDEFNTVFSEYFQYPMFFPMTFEQFNFIEEKKELKNKLNILIKGMAANKATMSTTTHLFASQVGRSFFKTPLHPDDVPITFSPQQLIRMNDGFDLLMRTMKTAHNEGVKICLGTDCMDGGKAALSEMLLFYEAGFSIEDILQIATYNGASSMNLLNNYGSIEVGKKADLVLFEESPFDNYRNFLAKKTVIKGGKLYGG